MKSCYLRTAIVTMLLFYVLKTADCSVGKKILKYLLRRNLVLLPIPLPYIDIRAHHGHHGHQEASFAWRHRDSDWPPDYQPPFAPFPPHLPHLPHPPYPPYPPYPEEPYYP